MTNLTKIPPYLFAEMNFLEKVHKENLTVTVHKSSAVGMSVTYDQYLDDFKNQLEGRMRARATQLGYTETITSRLLEADRIARVDFKTGLVKSILAYKIEKVLK